MVSLIKFSVAVAFLAASVYLLRVYMQGAMCESTARIDGKTVIVTGANTGIGRETVVDLVNRGGRVIMACRSVSKATAALEYVKNMTSAGDDKVVVMQLDLASFKSIHTFVDEFKKKETRLDILVNNAGVAWMPYSTTDDGFETTFGVNHLGHFLLTNLLLDLLKASAPSRVVTVSSLAHQNGVIDFDNLNGEKEYHYWGAYGNSKLANVLFSRELAKRTQGTGVHTYSLHPGVITTELARDAIYTSPVFYWVRSNLFPYLIKDSVRGAQTSVCCAVSEAAEYQQTGGYYSDCALTDEAPAAKDDEVARRLWEVSLELTGLKK